MDQVSEILKQLIPLKGKSKADVARQLGISSQLLGQYVNDRQQPKPEFYLKWKKTFGEDLLVPRETNVSDSKLQEPEALDYGPDYKEKYIKLLEAQLSYFTERIDTSLAMIQGNVIAGRADLRALIDYEVIKDSKGSAERREKIMVEINKLIAENLSDKTVADKPAAVGK